MTNAQKLEAMKNKIQDLTNAAGEIHEYYGDNHPAFIKACKKLDAYKARYKAFKKSLI